MSDDQMALFLTGAMVVCAVMALVSVARIRSRGWSAACLAVGFVSLGLGVLALRQKWQQSWLVVFGILLVCSLAGDFVARSVKAGEDR